MPLVLEVICLIAAHYWRLTHNVYVTYTFARRQPVGVPEVPEPHSPVLHGADGQAGAHERHTGIHAAVSGRHAEPARGAAIPHPELLGLGGCVTVSRPHV